MHRLHLPRLAHRAARAAPPQAPRTVIVVDGNSVPAVRFGAEVGLTKSYGYWGSSKPGIPTVES